MLETLKNSLKNLRLKPLVTSILIISWKFSKTIRVGTFWVQLRVTALYKQCGFAVIALLEFRQSPYAAKLVKALQPTHQVCPKLQKFPAKCTC